MTLLQIYEQYQDDQRKPTQKVSGYITRGRNGRYENQHLFLGPWTWQMIYKLHRLSGAGKGNGDKHALPENSTKRGEIKAIQEQLLKPGGVHKMALSARWAQLVSRKKEEE